MARSGEFQKVYMPEYGRWVYKSIHGNGIFDSIKDIGSHIFKSAASQLSKEAIKKGSETAIKSAAEQIAKRSGEKVGNLIIEKLTGSKPKQKHKKKLNQRELLDKLLEEEEDYEMEGSGLKFL